MESSYINIENISIRYAQMGEGPDLLLVHGIGTYLENWKMNIEGLAERFKVTVLDLPGHGLSSPIRNYYTIRYFSDKLKGFISQLGLRNVLIAGHSFGACVAMNLALDATHLLKGLVLVNGTLFSAPKVPTAFKILKSPLLFPIFRSRTRQDVQILGRTCFGDPENVPEEWIDDYYKYTASRKETSRVIHEVLKSNLDKNGVKKSHIDWMQDRLVNYSLPTLVVSGGQDRVLPPISAEMALDMIPGSELVRVPHGGHELPYECPDEFNSIIMDFAEKLWQESSIRESMLTG